MVVVPCSAPCPAPSRLRFKTTSGFRAILQTKDNKLKNKSHLTMYGRQIWISMATFVWHGSSCGGLSFRSTSAFQLSQLPGISARLHTPRTSSKLSVRISLDDAIENALPPWSSSELYQTIVPVHHLVDKEDQQVLSTLEKICGIPRVLKRVCIHKIMIEDYLVRTFLKDMQVVRHPECEAGWAR